MLPMPARLQLRSVGVLENVSSCFVLWTSTYACARGDVGCLSKRYFVVLKLLVYTAAADLRETARGTSESLLL